MERAEFIGRVRDRLVAVPRIEPEVPVGWGVSIADRGERFQQELTAIGGVVHRVPGAEAASVLERWSGATFLTTSERDLPPGIEGVIAGVGGELLRWPDPTTDEVAATVDVGLTSALWGVAETGSVLLSSAPPAGRVPSLVVPVHVVFLPEERLLGTVEEVFATIGTFDDLPSNLVLITGPSKSADIGMELAVGVHGPGEVHVVLTS